MGMSEWEYTLSFVITDYFSTMTLGWWNWTGIDKSWSVKINVIIVEE